MTQGKAADYSPFTPCKRESQQSVYARMCGMKQRYASRKEAKQNGSRVYRCPFCRFFHRTSKD